MGRNFSFKSFFIAVILLSLCLFSFVVSKGDAYKDSLDVLHSIVIPVEVVDELNEDDGAPQETEEVVVDGADDLRDESAGDPIKQVAVDDEEVTPAPTEVEIMDNPRAMISIIVYDYGLSQKFSEKVFETGMKNLSVAFSPYADNVSELVDMAYRFEGEPWISLYVHKASLENKDYGPLAILEGLSKEINDKRASEVLKRRNGSQGVVTFYDGRTSSKELSGVFKRVKQEQLPMVLLSAVSLFDKEDALHSSNVLGYNQSASEVASFLDSVKARAFVSGQAIVAVPPTPFVLEELTHWSDALRRESIQIVPLSVLLER